MRKTILVFLIAAGAAYGQYKAEPAGAPPAGLAASVAGKLEKDGAQIVSADGAVFCEIWFTAAAPSGPKSAEESVSLPNIPHGALLGAIRFPSKAADRRGQGIKPGVYTLRYSNYPVNGDHQGAAPQRDFAVLTPAADDQDGAATPNFETLMKMSRKASGTPHPSVLSIWKVDDFSASFAKQGENDWVLQKKVGDVPLAIILIGKAES